jgi:hypothetical protein
MWRPLDDDLSSPWVLRRSSPVFPGEADSRRTFRSTCLPTVSPADPRSELGPCSLDPDRRFCGAYAELIRDLSSPTDFCNCVYDVRATKPGLFTILAGTETSISFLFSTCHALSLAEAVTRGEPRYVRCRRPQCWFLPLAQVCPAVMPPSPPHLRGFRLRSVVRIDVHGSEDRAKDASPGACDDLSCLRRVHAHRSRMPTAFPSSASSGHPLSSARLVSREDCPRPESDRPRPSFRQRPAKSAAFQKTGMPFTATTREGTRHAKGLLPPAFAPALSLTPPTLFPQGGDSVVDGHCKVTVRSPAGP